MDSKFEKWWAEQPAAKLQPPVLAIAFKELCESAWNAAQIPVSISKPEYQWTNNPTSHIEIDLYANGNAYQLYQILQETAETIKQADMTNTSLPWFRKMNGGYVQCNWEVKNVYEK